MRSVPALTVGAYLALGAGWFVHGLVSRDEFFAWTLGLALLWTPLAVALLLRRYWASVALGIFEVLSLTAWIGQSGDWDLFVLQVVLTVLILSPPVERYVRPPSSVVEARRQPVRGTWMLLAFAAGLLFSAALYGFSGNAAAIPLAVLAGVLLLAYYRTRVPLQSS